MNTETSVAEKTVQHTLGPWHLGGITDPTTDPRYSVWGPTPPDAQSGEWIAKDITPANAHLIAAAPELLACLRRMCGMYGAYSRRLAALLAEDDGTVWTFERANSLALEAIAKAEGAQ